MEGGLCASVLRVPGPTRLVVRIESTKAVVELQLGQALTLLEQARARLVTPLRPCPATVLPGAYSEGVFRDSVAAVDWPAPPARARIPVSRFRVHMGRIVKPSRPA